MLTLLLTMSSIIRNENPSTFVLKYLNRLKLIPEDFLHRAPTIDHLRRIQEAHLQHIPFENLSQHGCARPSTITNLNDVAVKLLDKNRGGFCLEVNGLLAEFLIKLGYTVCRVHAYVYVNNEIRPVTSHIILIVSCPNESSSWMVDVGFGEPAIHPLQYDNFDEIQVTPDGMRSKISKLNDGTDDVVLYWWHAPMNDWVPRLKWNYAESMLGNNGPPLSSFGSELATTLAETSIFAQKLICCRLTREQKFTVAGNKLKVSGPPRFIYNSNHDDDANSSNIEPQPYAQAVVSEIESVGKLQTILREHFGIPIDETEGIALTKSLAADPNVWSNH